MLKSQRHNGAHSLAVQEIAKAQLPRNIVIAPNILGQPDAARSNLSRARILV